jgi:hypothetical protein
MLCCFSSSSSAAAAAAAAARRASEFTSSSSYLLFVLLIIALGGGYPFSTTHTAAMRALTRLGLSRRNRIRAHQHCKIAMLEKANLFEFAAVFVCVKNTIF